MAFARDVSVATASQTDFTLSFPYIQTTDVVISVDGATQTVGAGNDYIFFDSSTIRFNTPLTGGETVVRQRKTSQSSRLVDYETGSIHAETDLDNDSLQAFYMAQEAIDTAALALGLDATENWDATSKRIKNLADAVSGKDAVTKDQLDAVAILSGNVPTPDNPGEDGYILRANAGSFDWASALTAGLAALNTSNTFSGDGWIIFEKTGERVTIKGDTFVSPRLESYRDSYSDHCMLVNYAARGTEASPADMQDGDNIYTLSLRPRVSGSFSIVGNVRHILRNSGTEIDVQFNSCGVRVGSPSGAHKGAGSINYQGDLYHNGVELRPRHLLAEATADNDASLDLSWTGTYREIIIEVDHVRPASDNTSLFIRTSSDGGTSYDSGASDYQWAAQIFDLATNLAAATSGSAMMINGNVVGVGNQATEMISGTIHLFAADDSGNRTHLDWSGYMNDTSGNVRKVSGCGERKTNAVTDGVQFLFNTGNITSGRVRVYGIQ